MPSSFELDEDEALEAADDAALVEAEADEAADDVLAEADEALEAALPDDDPPQATSPNAKTNAQHAIASARLFFMILTFPRCQ